MLSVKIIDEDTLAAFRAYINKQVIKDPPDNLVLIYEQSVLTDLSYIRAEKYDSPEWKDELHNDKIPHNIQNPNYDRLMQMHAALMKSPNIVKAAMTHLKNIKDMLTLELKLIPDFKYKPQLLHERIDVRCCRINQDIRLLFNYFLTEIYHRQLNNEFTILKKITNDMFEEGELKDMLMYIHNIIENKDAYESAINDICSQLDQPPYSIEPTKITKFDDCKTIADVFNLMWQNNQ